MWRKWRGNGREEGRKGGRSEGFIKGKKSAGVEAPFIDPVKDSNARALTQPLS